MGGTTASQSAERSLALIAGREAWNDESPTRSAVTKVAGVLEAAAFFTAAVLGWTYHLTARNRPNSSVIVLAPIAFSIICLLFSVRQLLLVLIGRDLPFPYGARVVVRSVLALALITSAFAVMPGWASLNTWPLASPSAPMLRSPRGPSDGICGPPDGGLRLSSPLITLALSEDCSAQPLFSQQARFGARRFRC